MFNASPLCPSLLAYHVLFAFSENGLRFMPRAFVYLINVVKFCIWRASNDFRDVRPSDLVVLERVRVHVHFYLTLPFQVCS